MWLLAAFLAPLAARAEASAPPPRLAEALQLLQTFAEPSSAKLAAAGEEHLEVASQPEENPRERERRRREEQRERDRQQIERSKEEEERERKEAYERAVMEEARKKAEIERKKEEEAKRRREAEEARAKEAAASAAEKAAAAKENAKKNADAKASEKERRYHDAVRAAALVPRAGQHWVDEKAQNASLGSAKNRLLIFWAVGSEPRARQLVADNIRHARKFEAHGSLATSEPLHIDVYLAHYDFNRWKWQVEMGQDWYEDNVQYSAQLEGIKFWLARDLLTFYKKDTSSHKKATPPTMTSEELATLREVDLSSYEYLWFLDEDANFEGMNLTELVHLARKSESNIITPSIIIRNKVDGGASTMDKEVAVENTSHVAGDKRYLNRLSNGCQTGDSLCNFQAPRSDCLYRYTDFAEVSFPLLKPKAFKQVVAECGQCLPTRQSSWGLDRVWCNVAAEGQHKRERSCAVIDSVHIVHQNYQTLPKWRDDPTGFRQRDWDTYNNVHKAKMQQWVQMPKANECVYR